jgi:hypothetical protein
VIAFAVAVAPVAAALVAGVGARTVSAATIHDCHGKAAQDGHMANGADGAQHSHHIAPQHAEKGGCPDCDRPDKANCVGDGVKCCKLTGMVAVLPVVFVPAENVDRAASPPILTGWQAHPPPPPPRA